MGILSELFKQHPYLLAAISLGQFFVTWFMNNKATKLVSAIPMPTKNSSPGEIWWFKFFNNLVGNEKRADMPPLEASPNFIPAVNNKLAELGRAPVPDVPKPVEVNSDTKSDAPPAA